MIMTVIIEDGALQGAAVGDLRAPESTGKAPAPGQFWSGIVAGPKQTVRVVEVADKLSSLFTADPAGLMTELGALLKQRGLLK
ncbi:hypothetical protein [Actinophytocola sp.]|uniref:hypothetical protein n=1 Tax=Actinophytocola sp. TaxID=1872138 RepID=UPI00389B2DA1